MASPILTNASRRFSSVNQSVILKPSNSDITEIKRYAGVSEKASKHSGMTD